VEAQAVADLAVHLLGMGADIVLDAVLLAHGCAQAGADVHAV